ncbi:MAG TPA: O-antigen ligase domain-containing protein [Anaerolineae bacterium]|nr:O-antigen ligase domain-containing protein [Anaerolineae bacterium]
MMSKSASSPYRSLNSRAHFAACVSAAACAAFWLFLTLLLLSHASAANPGPFGWRPNPVIVTKTGWRIGLLAWLPLLILGGWAYSRTAAPPAQRRAWEWGRRPLTLPLLGLTLLALAHILTGAPLTLAVPLGLFWLVYLFLLNNNRTGWKWVLAIVLVGQSIVAIGQFAGQRPLNLTWLGEAAMDLQTPGTSVVLHNGVNWLRAYGLNSHPNQLGLLLAALLLMLWPFRRAPGRDRALIWLALGVGLAGLAVSWSRAAWLGLLAGAVVYALAWRRSSRQWPRFSTRHILLLLPLTAVLLIFLYTYSDIAANRLFLLDSQLEGWSLYERKRDAAIALQIITQNPVSGAGLGQYQAVAAQSDPAAQIVHNVPLLIAAELGLSGLALWLIFLAAPLLRPGTFSRFAPQTAVWLALIVISLAQPEPHLFLIKGAALWGLAAAAWSFADTRPENG